MTTKKLLYIYALVVIIVIGGVVWYFKKQPQKAPLFSGENLSNTTTSITSTTSTSTNTSISWEISTSSPLIYEYGFYPINVFQNHPEVLKAIQAVNNKFEPIDISLSHKNRVVYFSDGRQMLLLEGCRPHGCKEMAVLYDIQSKNAYAAFLDEPIVFLGNPDQTVQEVFKFLASSLSIKIKTGKEVAEDLNLKAFENRELGVFFLYDSLQVTPERVGNKIKFNGDGGVYTGDYIEVIKKDPNDSLENAIRKIILKNYPSSNCKVTIDNNNYPTFSKLGWIVGYISNPSSGGSISTTNNCNNDYINAGSPGLFLYIPSFPSKFLFWRGGAAINTEIIFSSFFFY